MPAHEQSILMTLSVALLFAAIFLFGGRVAYRPVQRISRFLLSFAPGISLAYTFVHVLPALNRINEFQTQSPDDFIMLFPEYSVYLWTMTGFLVFYGFESMVTSPNRNPENNPGVKAGAALWQPWVHISGFTLYAWLLTYLMVWSGKNSLALCLYAAAIGLHIFPIAGGLTRRYQAVYSRRGAYLLALASVAGWVSALTLNIPTFIVFNLVAFVAGGVVVNSLMAKLHKERDSKYWPLLAGAMFYTALLLILSRFEKVG